METPTLSASSSDGWNPASSSAMRAHATAYWMKKSIFLSSFLSTYREPSNPFTSPAIWVFIPAASNRVIGPIPELPARQAFQLSSTPIPRGVTAPKPVTTTRRCATVLLLNPSMTGSLREESQGAPGSLP